MSDTEARQLLVDMLGQAAQLEHSLLNAYIYTACSLRSTPGEFASVDGEENRRRAPQFERARMWKASILGVAHEEMRHLHYVQCLIRALGARPDLSLPARDANGVWKFPNWRIRIGEKPHGDDGTEIPVQRFGIDAIRNFILYESTDSLQDEDPFGDHALDLYRRLYNFEFALRVETMLSGLPDETDEDRTRKQSARDMLAHVYRELTPRAEAQSLYASAIDAAQPLPPLDKLRFQSIGDLYRNGILPLYETAFEKGWVVMNDRNLVDEQLNPDYAGQGFLPVGPIGRSVRFSRFTSGNQTNPLADYKRVEDIVDEIVDEGEGATLFKSRAQAMLDKVASLGIDGFLAAVRQDNAGARDDSYETPDWLYQAQLVRNAHLYQFAMIFVELEEETALSKASGLVFSAARDPLSAPTPAVRAIASELPAQFNAAYLAVLAWLARMYETREWQSDKPRRMAIEMLATWPLMSLAIRPMLELASFFDIDQNALFRFEEEDLPMLPIWAQQLVRLYNSDERSETINEEMDRLVVRTLRGVADWAGNQLWALDTSIPDAERRMIETRLKGLTRLVEFERQFPYRVAGGYSDRLPDLTYQATHPRSDTLSEAPDLDPAFADALVMRLRFAGRGLVQLATDPDPPTDEVGVTGTHMLHPADGDLTFNRALVFQNFEPAKTFQRDAPGLAPVGVNCIEATLLAPALAGGASGGYLPLAVMNSQGAVDASGVQQRFAMTGLSEVFRVDRADMAGTFGTLRINLETKDGVPPFLNGENHLVWQDGEPVDPFVLSVYADAASGERTRVLGREIYNLGKSVAEMEPYERLLTARGPVGFDSYRNVPDWARTPEVARMIGMPGYPGAFLKERAGHLAQALAQTSGEWTRDTVDTFVSLAERAILVAQPRGTTVAWLRFLLHYGHTLSGAYSDATPERLMEPFGKRAGLGLSLDRTVADRRAANSRWVVSYTKGLMDTDTLSDFVFGELHVPVTVSPGKSTFARSWAFPANIADAVAAYACDFRKPFWAKFDIDGNRRSTTVTGLDPDDPSKPITLVETLVDQTATSYDYVLSGMPSIAEYTGSIAIDGADASLRWRCAFEAADGRAAARCLALLAGAADAMGVQLGRHFAPVSDG